MPQAKQVSKRKRRSKAAPVLGAAGLLALASGVSAKTVVTTQTSNTGVSYQFLLGEEEISDVSLSTLGSLKSGVQLARGGGCGGGGCGGGAVGAAEEAAPGAAEVVAEPVSALAGVAAAAGVDAQDAVSAGGESTALGAV